MTGTLKEVIYSDLARLDVPSAKNFMRWYFFPPRFYIPTRCLV